jgi:cytochrome c-type biogenesis protein CcmF
MFGGFVVDIAFVLCVTSVISYFLHHRRGSPVTLLIGRLCYILTAISVAGIAAFLLSLILTHQFQYTYVWSYSSRELPTPLLVSTFYAGQEGSFTLWTLFTAVIGIFLLRHSSKKGYEPEVMAVFGLIQSSLLLMLIVKSPFLRVWQSWPGQVAEGFAPANGRGLNPLLQNYWMVIHPQVLFSGFSAMGVPYAYAVAALLKRDYTNWIRPATPWMVFAALILGTGIMMGGFWAYETLGWGGYWGWDPVENSSLVPWLFCIATIHTTLSQRKTGRFVKTNLILAMFCFLMVLYSTFLTRSGVLGDTSVHSFVDPGMWTYWMLIGLLALFGGIGGGLLFARRKEIPRPVKEHSYYSREFALFLGSAAVVVAAIFIVVGTSSPIVTEILQGKKSAVDTSYYVSTTLPLGIVIALLAGIGQLLWWTHSQKGNLWKAVRTPALLAACVTLLLVTVGVREPAIILFLFAAAFALCANLQVGWRIVKGNPKLAGGSVAHIGLAIMFFGFVASSKYDSKETISLTQGKPVEALGYTLTYLGYSPIAGEKYAFHVQVDRDGRRYTVAPIMFYSGYNDGLMRNPDIANLITRDFYLAPLSLEQKSEQAEGLSKLELKRGETRKVGDLDVTFMDFDFPVMQKAAMLEGKDVRIGAILKVRKGNGTPVTVTPAKVLHQGESRDEAARMEGGYEFTITAMHPDREAKENSRVEIGVKNLSGILANAAPSRDILIAEASVKPYINLVWSGVIVLLVGFLVTIVRRSQEAAMRPETVVEQA